MTRAPLFDAMYLGIEIGGTKLQVGIGDGDGPQLAHLERRTVDRRRGGEAIREQLTALIGPLLEQYPVERIGIGFGGPVDDAAGRTVTSHQVAGWDAFPLVDWCRQQFARPCRLANDCDAAALAEAGRGAGRGRRAVFFVTVGTGIGGGLVLDGQLHGQGRPAVAEIGHLRPGPESAADDQTVESLASGLGIAAAARRILEQAPRDEDREDHARLLRSCNHQSDTLSTRQIAREAEHGNRLAAEMLGDACRTLGWAIAQTITLVAPEVVVVGGGVSLIGEARFFRPLRQAVHAYVFPPLRESYQIVPAALGEEVVVHGAILVARTAPPAS